MLKNPLITTILVFCFLFAHGQKVSKIYNARGRLIVDTTYTISKRQLKKFTAIEDTLVKQLVDRINYPEVEREADIQGRCILSFTMNGGDTLKDVKVVKYVPGGPGLGKEAARVLKRVKVLKTQHSKQLKDTTYYVAVYFYEDVGSNEVNTGEVKIFVQSHSLLAYKQNTLDTAIHKWMDSVAILLKGRRREFDEMYKARGLWNWNYMHRGKYSQTGNPNVDTFSVYRALYRPGEEIRCYDCNEPNIIGFTYWPKDRKLILGYQDYIYLLDKGPVYYNVASYNGGWGGGPSGCSGAYLYTRKDTIYKGTDEKYVRSPADTSKYFVFINNYSTRKFLGSFIVGNDEHVFKKESHHPNGGLLITCRPFYKRDTRASYNPKDSVDYLLFNPDSSMSFRAGDTIFVSIEQHRLYDTKLHTVVVYNSVYQRYPFRARQMEDQVEYYRSNGGFVTDIEGNTLLEMIFGRKKHKDPNESDPVFLYLRKNKLVYRY